MNVSGKKIALISGHIQDEYLLHFVKSLAKENSLTVFCFNSCLHNFNVNFGQKVVVFTELPDMIGYMRGLEKRLENFDLIITSGTSSLSSFQASRVAHKFKIPLASLTCQTSPTTNRGFSNLEAIQFDVFQHSSIIFTPEERSKSRAILDGALENKIILLPFNYSDEKFSYSKQISDKFRNYLRIPLTTNLLLTEYESTEEKQLESVFLSIRMLKVTKKIPAGGIKLIVWNNLEISKQIKNRAFELGLADTVMFLEQDITSFARDLFCAVDISLSKEKSFDVDDGMDATSEKLLLTGARVLTLSPHVMDYGQIAYAINSQLSLVGAPEERNKRSAAMMKECNERNLPLEASIKQHLMTITEASKIHSGESNLLEEAESNYCQQKPIDAIKLKSLKEFIERCSDLSQRSQGHALLGDIARLGQNYDEACDQYSKSIDLEESNRAFTGLGHISSYAQSFEEAMVFFKKAASLSPDSTEAKFGMAVCLYKLAIFEESILWLSRCLAADPENKAYLGLFISCALKLRKTDDAIDYLEGLRNKGESRNSVLLHLATLYEKKGDYVKSCELMNQYSSKAG
jgi:tetratricopeptide (TPR) repeat protein